MTPETMRSVLDQLGLSTREFARLAGVDDRLVRRMMAGAVPLDYDLMQLLWMIRAWRRVRDEKKAR